jgi:hypothetical protein
MKDGLIVRRGFRPALAAQAPKATLRLRGVEGIPAATMLEAAERVRQAVALLGVLELSIEVVSEQTISGRPPAA